MKKLYRAQYRVYTSIRYTLDYETLEELLKAMQDKLPSGKTFTVEARYMVL